MNEMTIPMDFGLKDWILRHRPIKPKDSKGTKRGMENSIQNTNSTGLWHEIVQTDTFPDIMGYPEMNQDTKS